MAFNTKKHDKVLQRTLDEIRSGAFDSVKALENEVAELVAQGLPVESVRPQIMAAFKRYSESVKSVASPLTSISEDYLNQSSLPTEPADYLTQSQLLLSSEATLASTVESQAEDVTGVVVLGTIAGLSTAALIAQSRGRISGIQMESTDPNVRRQQRKLRKMLRGGVTGAELTAQAALVKRLLPNDVNTSASLYAKMSTASESVVGSYDGAFMAARSNRLGVERFRYEGSIIATSRDFCKSMIGREMSKDEIQSTWASSTWAGKEPGDPFVVRGGYNCLHYWVPVESEDE